MSDRIVKLRVLWSFLRATFEDWRDHVWREDLDGRHCCDGRECLCGGTTLRELYCETGEQP